jgi:hypothetical protein
VLLSLFSTLGDVGAELGGSLLRQMANNLLKRLYVDVGNTYGHGEALRE